MTLPVPPISFAKLMAQEIKLFVVAENDQAFRYWCMRRGLARFEKNVLFVSPHRPELVRGITGKGALVVLANGWRNVQDIDKMLLVHAARGISYVEDIA
jgi:hypothetical protein